MRILAIETSCDETALALVDADGGVERPTFSILKNIVSSQIAIHRPFGGVVPNLAKREHIKNLPEILKGIRSELDDKKPDLIAVTTGPGLEPALWAGIEFAKQLGGELDIPVVGANHMEGHLFSFLLGASVENMNELFPAIVLVVSGGHTILLKMDSLMHWEKLGETRDDAAGEVFDKVARMLDLPYPGGPEIQKLGSQGNRRAIAFPQPMRNQKNYEFSFSGIKTSVLYYLRDHPDANRADVAASFEEAVTGILDYKTVQAAEIYNAKSIMLCGGVAANALLREKLSSSAQDRGMHFFAPAFEFNTDNAAMIAAAAYMGQLRKVNYPLEADASMSL